MLRRYPLITFMMVLMIIAAGCSGGAETKEFQYKTAEQVKTMIEQEETMHIVDIQVENEFKEGHITGSIATYAYPVKTDEDKAKLIEVLPELQNNQDTIVIICPRGAGGAERTYDYFKEQGISEKRLFILKNGWSGWSYPELTEAGLQ